MFFKDSVNTFIIRLFSVLFALAVQIIVARFLGPAAKGELQIALFLLSLMSLLVGLGYERAIIYNLGQKKFGLEEIWYNANSFLVLSYGLGILLWLPLVFLARSLFGDIRFELLAIIFLIIPVDRLFSIQLGIFNGRGEIPSGNKFTLINSLIYALLVALLVIWIYPASESVLYANFLSYAAISAVVILYFHKKLGLRSGFAFNKKLIGGFLTYSLKGQIGNITNLIAERLDLLIMNYFLGRAAAGVYSAALNFADLLMFLPFILAYVIFPHAARRDQPQGWILVRRISRMSLALNLASALAIGLIAPLAIPVLFSADFGAAVRPLWILLGGMIFYSTLRIIASGLSGMGYPLVFSICTIVAVISSLILNLKLVPIYQAYGAASASAISYFLAFLTLMLLLKFHFRQKLADFLFLKREDLIIMRDNVRRGLNREEEQ